MESSRLPHFVGRNDRPAMYAVSIRGHLGAGLLDAFSPMVATTGEGGTTLTGLIEDQAALHGVLAKIQSFGLELDEVRRLTTACKPPNTLGISP